MSIDGISNIRRLVPLPDNVRKAAREAVEKGYLVRRDGSVVMLDGTELPPGSKVPEKTRDSKAAQLAPELPFDDIWTPEPEANLVIPSLGIAPGPAHLVTGSWYTGKTLLLATMGLCTAAGRDLFNLYRVRQGKWLHFDHEMGRRHLKRYVQRLRAGLGIEPEVLRDQMSLRVLPRLNLRTENALDHYTELLSGYSIATLDPLRAAAPGADENKSEFREYLDMLAIVSDRTKCAVVVLHHGGKPTEGAQRRNTGRGTSAIDDAVQSKFVLTAEEKGAPMLVTHEKTRELVSPLDDFYLEIDNSIEGAVRLVHRLPEEIAQAKSSKDEARAADHLRAGVEAVERYFMERTTERRFRGTETNLRQLVGGRTAIVAKGIAHLKSIGRLVREGDKSSGVWVLR